jgi:MoaA/NifB/PqqE/SkfB family radical SAM enzyme
MNFKRIHLELTNHCNFCCEFCPDRLITRPRGNMDRAMMRRVLEEIAAEELSPVVCFHLMGEPLLHPHLLEGVQLAGELGLEAHLTTNGWLLTDEMMNSLLDAETHTIIVSVQTPDPASFELRQAKVSFDEYRERVTSALARALDREHRSEVVLSLLVTPFQRFLLPSRQMSIINSRADLVRRSMEWLESTVRQCSRDDVKAQFHTRRPQLEKRLGKLRLLARNQVRITRNLVLETRPLGDWVREGLDESKLKAAHWGCCEGLTEQVGILWNGDLVYCCVDFDGETVFGNLEESTIREAFRKKEVRQAIHDFRSFRIRHPRCRKCLGDPSLARSLGRQFGSIFYFKLFRHLPGLGSSTDQPVIDI